MDTKSNNLTPLTEKDVREALTNFVSSKCCYSKKAAKEMTFTNIETIPAYHYKLESQFEIRETEWKVMSVPKGYRGGAGSLPSSKWDVQVERPKTFGYTRKVLEVPNSANIEECARCFGRGEVECFNCQGKGQRTHQLHSGITKCMTCHTSGWNKCLNCDGHGFKKRYLELTAVWESDTVECIVHQSKLPKPIILAAEGKVILKEELQNVQPVSQFNDPALKDGSALLIKKHEELAFGKAIRQQRHQVRMIPICQVHYKWKNKSDYFLIYGTNKKVYAPNFPQKCNNCLCCTVSWK